MATGLVIRVRPWRPGHKAGEVARVDSGGEAEDGVGEGQDRLRRCGFRRCAGAAAPEPDPTRARGTDGRGAVQGWDETIPAGPDHAAPSGSSTGSVARRL
jgi:hypothetical protein